MSFIRLERWSKSRRLEIKIFPGNDIYKSEKTVETTGLCYLVVCPAGLKPQVPGILFTAGDPKDQHLHGPKTGKKELSSIYNTQAAFKLTLSPI
jgi:hypothetical protein